jgi:moderate conductance mechanosensitive channel
MELPTLHPSVELVARIGLIVVAGIVLFAVVRAGVGISVRHMIERRAGQGPEPVLPSPEMERRVSTVARLVVRVAGAVIGIIAALMILGAVGIDIGPAIAGLGVVGIAVGLGAQTLVKDWLAGVFVVLENQYSQGDVVRIAGVEGAVEDFSLRRTVLRERDGTVHSVPNGQIVVSTNLSRGAGGYDKTDAEAAAAANVPAEETSA